MGKLVPRVVGLGLTRSGIAWAGGVLAAVVVAVMFVTWQTATADCLKPGTGGGSMFGAFETAFEEYGGSALLGCPIIEVHKWGPGYVQDLEGGVAGNGGLFTLDRENVYVLAGPAWQEYRFIADGATPDFAGVPDNAPMRCNGMIVYSLRGGLGGPSGLVTNPSGAHVWIPADIWAVYQRLGGPFGPLGAPIERRVDSREAQTVVFEGGTVSDRFGEPVDIDANLSTDAEPFDLGRCDPADLESVYLGEFDAG